MSRYLKGYVFFLCFIAMVLIFAAYEKDLNPFTVDYAILLLALFAAEIGYISYGPSNKATLTAPINNIGVLFQPLLLVYLAIVLYNVVFRVVIRYREKIQEPLFNMKFIFNVSLQIILTAFAKLMMQHIQLVPSMVTLFELWGVNFILVIVNSILVTCVVFLAGNKKAFGEYQPLSYIHLINYYTLITALIAFMFKAYSTLGLAIAILLVLFTQTTTLMRSSSKAVNDRLILDKLTRAYNRTYLEEVLEIDISRRRPFTLIFIDLDDFKLVNDAYGHVVGDGLLVDFVAIVKNLLTKKEMLFRYGGDEFCIVSYEDDSLSKFNKMISDIVFMYKMDSSENSIHYHISAGEYKYTGRDALTFQEVINYVDQHMYRNKRAKKAE